LLIFSRNQSFGNALMVAPGTLAPGHPITTEEMRADVEPTSEGGNEDE
jgi:hypothetical protein